MNVWGIRVKEPRKRPYIFRRADGIFTLFRTRRQAQRAIAYGRPTRDPHTTLTPVKLVITEAKR